MPFMWPTTLWPCERLSQFLPLKPSRISLKLANALPEGKHWHKLSPTSINPVFLTHSQSLCFPTFALVDSSLSLSISVTSNITHCFSSSMSLTTPSCTLPVFSFFRILCSLCICFPFCSVFSGEPWGREIIQSFCILQALWSAAPVHTLVYLDWPSKHLTPWQIA